MQYSFNAAGVGEALVGTFKVGATVVAGQVVIFDTTNKYADITDPSETAAADAIGVTLGGATYDATPTTAEGGEGVVECVYSPLAVYCANISGGAAAGTALRTASSAHIITQTSASATVISAAEVGALDMSHGTICGLTGVNKNIVRRITSDAASTSVTVTVAFPASVAVGDKMVRVPFGVGVQAVRLCTEFTEADGYTSNTGTGIDANVVKVTFDTREESYPTAAVYFALGDHFLNPRS